MYFKIIDVLDRMIELIPKSGAQTPAFINLGDDVVRLIDQAGTLLLQADCEKDSIVHALTKLSIDNRRYYLSTVDLCTTMNSAHLNSKLACAIIKTAIENSIRIKPDDMNKIVARLILSLETHEVFEVNSVVQQSLAPYFSLNGAINDQSLTQLVYWLDTLLAKSDPRLCILVKNIHHTMREKVIGRCLTIEKQTQCNSKFVLCERAEIIDKNIKLTRVFVPRASEKQVLTELNEYVKQHQTRHSQTTLLRIIQLTQCHPMYLQKISHRCLSNANRNVSVSQEWNKLSNHIGNTNLGKLSMLTENAYKLLLAMRHKELHKITSKAFVASSDLQLGSIQRSYEQLSHAGLVAKKGKESYIKDPALKFFLCSMSSL
jgi:hypothetical protein